MGFLRAARIDRDYTRGRWVHDDLHKARKVKDGHQDYVTGNTETRVARRTELVLLRVHLRSIFEGFNALKQLSKNPKGKIALSRYIPRHYVKSWKKIQLFFSCINFLKNRDS
jgi:hypothetical protein